MSVEWLKLHTAVQGVQVQSLFEELRSHILWGKAKKKIKK